MTSDEKLTAIYDVEQNVRIQSFWDAGWTFSIGDSSNGFKVHNAFDTFTEGVDWLYEKVIRDV